MVAGGEKCGEGKGESSGSRRRRDRVWTRKRVTEPQLYCSGRAVCGLRQKNLRAAANFFAGRASMRALFWPKNWAEPTYSPEFLRAGCFAESARVALTYKDVNKCFQFQGC